MHAKDEMVSSKNHMPRMKSYTEIFFMFHKKGAMDVTTSAGAMAFSAFVYGECEKHLENVNNLHGIEIKGLEAANGILVDALHRNN